MKMKTTRPVFAGLAVCALAFAATAGTTCRLSPKGLLGERFETSLRGNFMKLDLEKDFFRPFVERTRKGGFIGLGKNADAAVHYAANTRDPDVIARKEKIVDFIVRNQLPDGYTGFFCEEARLAKLWDVHEMGFIVQGLMSDWELFGNKAALEAAKRNVDYVLDRYAQMKPNWEFDFITDRERPLGFGYGVARPGTRSTARSCATSVRSTRGTSRSSSAATR